MLTRAQRKRIKINTECAQTAQKTGQWYRFIPAKSNKGIIIADRIPGQPTMIEYVPDNLSDEEIALALYN